MLGERDRPAYAPRGAPDVDAAVLDKVRQALSPTPTHIDEICRATDLSAAEVAAALMELEIAGRALTLVGGAACAF
jgi:DNA processing protein